MSSLILLSNADTPRVLRLLYNVNKGNLNTLQEDLLWKELKEEQKKNKKLYGDGYKRNFVTERLHRNKENYIEVNDLINVK